MGFFTARGRPEGGASTSNLLFYLLTEYRAFAFAFPCAVLCTASFEFVEEQPFCVTGLNGFKENVFPCFGERWCLFGPVYYLGNLASAAVFWKTRKCNLETKRITWGRGAVFEQTATHVQRQIVVSFFPGSVSQFVTSAYLKVWGGESFCSQAISPPIVNTLIT